LGGGTAYAGFTGGTGGLTATQDILSWTFRNDAGVSAPAGLTATATSGTQVSLSWAGSAGATSYLIERKTGATGVYAPVGSTAAGVTTYADSGLSPGTEYVYRVRAANGPLVSDYSNEASVTPPVPPVTPTTGRAVAAGPTEVLLTWQDNATNEDGY